MQKVTVIILTFNEKLHIERCLKSLLKVTNQIFIIDSFSTDNTVEIAETWGAKVIKNEWVNYATQFNFGINNNPFQSDWIMRMDADEYITDELAEEINGSLGKIDTSFVGIYIKRRVYFLNQWIKHGGYYPIWLLRIWRINQGICEESWMDEHIKISNGKTLQFENDLIDHNLNNITWWTQKHNNYATREAIDLLNIEHNFNKGILVSPNLWGSQEEKKRYLKLKYAQIPLFIRPFLYFVYRYFFKLGFLDGKAGIIWHFLQGFWYRFLVDIKVLEAKSKTQNNKSSLIKYFKLEYNKDLE
jgi:glycosyltransferase involved in cell wall biosynthesis